MGVVGLFISTYSITIMKNKIVHLKEPIFLITVFIVVATRLRNTLLIIKLILDIIIYVC